ncbi:hypothetical protein DL771_007206 [Monosporascus sp. 5C6A]|nr:hypothetical protein DL771_007206 [Monosporascus sp. 5C6A]
MQSCCSSTSAPDTSATCTCNALLCACPRVSQPEHPDRIAYICRPSGKTFCGAAKPANTQAARNHVEDRSQTEKESLANKSRMLLTEIRNLDSIRAASEAAWLMTADPAIVQVGTARGPTLEASSRRLLTLVENMEANRGSPGAVDPAILRMGSPRQVVREGVSGGDHDALRDAKNINPEQLERLLLLKIRNPGRFLEGSKAVDRSIIRESLQESCIERRHYLSPPISLFRLNNHTQTAFALPTFLFQAQQGKLDSQKEADMSSSDFEAVPGQRGGTKPAKPCRRNPEPHTEFLPLHCRVAAYPFIGGIVLGYFIAVQLKQLSLSSFDSAARSGHPADEEELALAMIRQDAHWWPSLSFYSHHYERLSGTPVSFDFHLPPRINIGYSSSGKGVWINSALITDDRWEILKRRDARFYDDVEDWDDIRKTLEEE